MKIILAAGGTGGHIFPAVSVAKCLTNKGHDIVFATDQRGRKYIKTGKFIIQKMITSNRLLLYVSLCFNILVAVVYLLKNRPSCVVGFGGYPSVPFVFAAQILKIPTIIHEQNANLGKANRLLKKLCKKVLLSCDINCKKAVLVGNPTRFEKEYIDHTYSVKDPFCIFVFGGSQGSKIVSQAALDAILSLHRDDICVYHQAHKDDIATIKEQYKKHNIKCDVRTFFDDINNVYTSCNLVISRSGASTIFELIGFCIPSILIPYEKSINGDQLCNAQYLQQKQGCIIVRENELKNLSDIVQKLLQNKESLLQMSKSLQQLKISNIANRIAIENSSNFFDDS